MSKILPPKTVKTVQTFLAPALDSGILSEKEYAEIIKRIQPEQGQTQSPMKPTRYLTKREYAALRGVSVPTVNRWLQRGWLNFFRTPTVTGSYGHVRIPEDAEPAKQNNDAGRV